MSCPSQSLTTEQALDRLRARVAQYDTLTESAKALGVSAPYLSDILKGRRDIGPKIAQALRLEKTVRYNQLGDCG
jgi:plasmid maintenance system antidote protein VapI